MIRVDWSDLARDNLDALVRYISRDSAFYARRFGEKVVLATRRLKEFPESGRMIPGMIIKYETPRWNKVTHAEV